MKIRSAIDRGLVDWGRFTARHPWPVIGSLLLLAVALGSQLPKLTIETSTDRFLHEDDPIRVVYDEFRRQFGRDDVILIAIRPPAIFDLGFLEKLRAFHRELEARVPYLERVESLINARETIGSEEELVVGELLEDWPQDEKDVAELEHRVLSNPLYRNVLISEDARVTTISIRTQD